MALGAQKSDIQWMVLARGLRLSAVGVALGLMLSAAAARFLRSFLYGVNPLDPVAFTGGGARLDCDRHVGELSSRAAGCAG